MYRNSEQDDIYNFLEGWVSYSNNANSYYLKNHLIKPSERFFQNETSTKEYNRFLKFRKYNN